MSSNSSGYGAYGVFGASGKVTAMYDGLRKPFHAELGWLKNTRFVLASGSAIKADEIQRILNWYGITLYVAPEAVGGEDSEEDFRTYEEIVSHKAHLVRQEFTDKNRAEQDAVLKFLNIDDPKKVYILSEDRGCDWDTQVRDHKLCRGVWAEIRDKTQDPLVKEAFEKGHAFPGKRFNELRNAYGGTVPLLEKYHEACEILREAGVNFDPTHTTHITLQIAPLEGNGRTIKIHLTQEHRRFKKITPEIRALNETRATPLEPDDLDVPEGEKGTMRELWDDPNSGYHDQRSLAARAVHELMAEMKIPMLSKPDKTRTMNYPDARILSSLNLAEPDVFKPRSIGGRDVALVNQPIKSLADFEMAFNNAEGVVFEKLPNFNPRSHREKMDHLGRVIITIMGACYYAAMSNLGAPHASGRPLAVHKSLMNEGGVLRFLRDLYGAGTISKDPDRMFRFYETPDELEAILDSGWDPRKLRRIESNPEDYDLKDAAWLREVEMQKWARYSVGFLGSSVCRQHDVNENAKSIVMNAARCGFDIRHGGGTRGTMDSFTEGAVKAFQDGFTGFHNTGVRVPEASKKEGAIWPKLLALSYHTGLPLIGDKDSDHARVGHLFSVVNMMTLAARQHITLAPNHANVYNFPGLGTVYEMMSDCLHNYYVESRGYGIYPGFMNDQKKLIALMNTKDCFNFMYGLFDEEQRRMLDIEGYNDSASLSVRLARDALEQGFEVPQDMLDYDAVKQGLQPALERV